MARSRYGWPYSHPPNVDFDINEHSEQAKGLVFWLPLLGPRYGPYLDRARGLVMTPYNSPVWTPDGWLGNALLFDNASNEYLSVANVPVTAVPITITAKVKCDGIANFGRQTILSLSDGTGAGFFLFNLYRSNLSYRIEARTQPGGITYVDSFTENVWFSAAAVFPSSNSRYAYLEGVPGAENTADGTPSGIDTLYIGANNEYGLTKYLSANAADIRVYNVAKNGAEVYEIHADPWDLVRPRVRLWSVKLPAALGNPWYAYAQM